MTNTFDGVLVHSRQGSTEQEWSAADVARALRLESIAAGWVSLPVVVLLGELAEERGSPRVRPFMVWLIQTFGVSASDLAAALVAADALTDSFLTSDGGDA